MNIALLSDSTKMPNLALMKLATYHKNKGDEVSFYIPLFNNEYDKIYYSKIFSFTKINPYVFGNIEKGGTGFDIKKRLPDEIDMLPCDYSIYPECDYALGFLTRGCIRSCSWCVVPVKEGMIRPYRTVEQIARPDTNKIIFMDNNLLASEHGIGELEKLTSMPYKVDFNQGLDARLITPEIAALLAKIKWLRYIRVSCDTSTMVHQIKIAYEYLRSAGYKGEIFCYVLGQEFKETYTRVTDLRNIKGVTPFLQPYRDFNNKVEPPKLLKELARWVNQKRMFKTLGFWDFLRLSNKETLLDRNAMTEIL